MVQTATANTAALDLVIYSVGQAMHALFADVVKGNVENVMPKIMAVNFYGAGVSVLVNLTDFYAHKYGAHMLHSQRSSVRRDSSWQCHL